MASADSKGVLWLRWVAANAAGEMVGLGATFAAIALLLSGLEAAAGASGVLVSFLVSVAAGAVEATVVGLAQWWAMHPWFPSVTRRAWWLATLAGALVAYVLGFLPSTLMSLGEEAGQAPAAEPAQWTVLLLAAGLGVVAGAVLSFAQWLALRRSVPRARWWIPANMLAWLAGMPIIFAGIDLAQRGRPLGHIVLIMAGCLLLAGCVVGAIHGAMLVRLASPDGEHR